MDQWHTAHAWCNWRILPPSNGHQRVTYENRRLWRYQERKLTSLPKVTTRCRCNDVEIESIGTPHTTVSQQAEQVKIVTGQRATQKDNRSRRKIVCRWSESRTKLRIESPINPNINSEIEVTLLPSHDGNRQSIWRSSRRSNEFSEEGYSRVRSVKTYRQAKTPPGGGLPRHTPTSLPRSPTDKSKVRREACLPSRPRFYWSPYRECNHEVDRMVTEVDFQRRLPCHAASMSQCHFRMTAGSKRYPT